MVYVTLHAAWMVLAVVIGTVAGYLGLLRATQRPDGSSVLPGRFKMKPHIDFGTAYYGMLYLGLTFGVIMHAFLLPGGIMPPGAGRAHVVLACLIAVFYAAAWVMGGRLARNPAGEKRARPRLHMIFNFTGCTLIAVQIALAVYYVWIGPNV